MSGRLGRYSIPSTLGAASEPSVAWLKPELRDLPPYDPGRQRFISWGEATGVDKAPKPGRITALSTPGESEHSYFRRQYEGQWVNNNADDLHVWHEEMQAAWDKARQVYDRGLITREQMVKSMGYEEPPFASEYPESVLAIDPAVKGTKVAVIEKDADGRFFIKDKS